MEFSKLVVMLVVLVNCGFAGVVLYIFANKGVEPTALITAWFAFTTGELWALSKIKREKKEEK